MTLSLSNFLICCGLILPSTVKAAVRTYDFNIGWVTASPDGFERPTIGINGQWPIPRIQADVGDRIVVNVQNDLGNQSTSLHFHGLYMNGSTHMDGVSGVTQCAIPPGSNFVYNFTVDQSGTYWYHSHHAGQYPDGLRGPLIVHDPESPYKDAYDDELVLTLSDWYHDQMVPLIKSFISVGNPTGAEPVPNNALMNETQNYTINVEPNKTYLIHLLNIGAFAGQYFWIEGHEFDIVEVDGIYTQRTTASEIYVTAAQRYSILLTTKNTTDSNFAIVGSMDTDLFDTIPADLNWNVTSYLVYDSSKALPTPALVDEFDPFDDFTLVPYDQEPLYTNPDQQVVLDVVMANLGNGANYAFFNNITYVAPKVPTLYSVLTAGDDFARNPQVYGSATNSFVLKHNEVVEIVVNNHDTGKHPFHLHGHAFQAVARGEDESGDYDPDNTTFPTVPMRRDTFMVRPEGNIVLRFKSDNPGVWFFHCHIEWHVDSGLIATLIEAPLTLQSQYLNSPIPSTHLQSCLASNISTIGNAAANGADLSTTHPTELTSTNITSKSISSSSSSSSWLDLTGETLPPAPLPSGFTPKGYVAMAFSALSAVLGLASIVWYGLGDLKNSEQKNLVQRETGSAEEVDGNGALKK